MVYSATIIEKDPTIHLENFMDYIKDHDEIMNRAFSDIIVNEAASEKLQKIGDTVKSVLANIKDLINKFFDFVKNSISNIGNKIKEYFNSHHYADKVLQSAFKDLTYVNLMAAKENGWPGLRTTMMNSCIDKIANFSDSKFFNDMYKSFFTDKIPNSYEINYNADIEGILNAPDYDSAKKIYDNTQVKLKEYESYSKDLSGNKETVTGSISVNSDNNMLNLDSPLFAYNNTTRYTNNKDNKEYYYPDKYMFATTKDLATNIERHTKEFINSSNSFINSMKSTKKDVFNDKISNKFNFKGRRTDSEQYKIQTYYLSAKYKYTSVMIKNFSLITRVCVRLIYVQFVISISTCTKMNNAIHKYIPGFNSSTALSQVS